MLFGLRHNAVVGGDGKQHEIDAVRAGEHILDKALVAGHVDDARRSTVRQIEMGETAVGRKTLEELVAKYPVSEAAEKAKRRITGLNASGPAATAAPGGKP